MYLYLFLNLNVRLNVQNGMQFMACTFNNIYVVDANSNNANRRKVQKTHDSKKCNVLTVLKE